MNETVNKQLNECLNQLKVKLNDLNTSYHKAVEQVKPYEERCTMYVITVRKY